MAKSQIFGSSSGPTLVDEWLIVGDDQRPESDRPPSLRKMRLGRSGGADGKQLLTTRSLLLGGCFGVSLENGIQAFSSGQFIEYSFAR